MGCLGLPLGPLLSPGDDLGYIWVAFELIFEQLGDKLPSLPQILEDLVKTLGDLNVTLVLIEEQIRIDQSISLEILKIVNKV